MFPLPSSVSWCQRDMCNLHNFPSDHIHLSKSINPKLHHCLPKKVKNKKLKNPQILKPLPPHPTVTPLQSSNRRHLLLQLAESPSSSIQIPTIKQDSHHQNHHTKAPKPVAPPLNPPPLANNTTNSPTSIVQNSTSSAWTNCAAAVNHPKPASSPATCSYETIALHHRPPHIQNQSPIVTKCRP